MLKNASLLVCMVLLSVMLAACGGSDDEDPTATVAAPAATATVATSGDSDDEEEEATATATEEVAEPTATEEPATPTTEPTEEPTATAEPTEEPATPTAAAVTTVEATPDSASPTEEAGDTESDPVVEAALMDMLLTQEEVPEEFILLASGPSAQSDDSMAFCDQPSFSRPESRLASVEAEFERDPATGPFLLQSLTAYPEDVAIEAFDYVRTITSDCEEWTEEDGITYQLEVVDIPDYGDESHGLLMTFDVPGVGEAEVRFSLARFGGILLAMGYISVFDADIDEFTTITEDAVAKIEASEFRP